MDKLCGILNLRNNCTDVLNEVLPLCHEACVPSGTNPRGLMGDACHNFHPTDSKHSCAEIKSLELLTTDGNSEKCNNILRSQTQSVDNKLQCLSMFNMVSQLSITNISKNTVASDEIDIVKKVASDLSF